VEAATAEEEPRVATVEDTAAAFEVVGSAGEAILEVAGAAPKDRADGAEALVEQGEPLAGAAARGVYYHP